MKRLYAGFVLVLIGLGVGGALIYGAQRDRFKESVNRELIAVANLRASQITVWRKALLTDARRMMTRPLFRQHVADWLGDPTPARAGVIRDYWRGIEVEQDFIDVHLADAGGAVLLTYSGASPDLHPAAKEAIARAVADRQPRLTDLHHGGGSAPPHVCLIAPLFADAAPDAPPLAVCVLIQNADAFLYPLVRDWPVPSNTAESLLARHDGDHVLYLSPLRHAPGAALFPRVSLSESGVPAVRGLLGHVGVMRGVDYRGAPVLSASAAVPDTPWVIVAKIDEAEAMHAWRATAVMGLMLLGALVALAGLGGIAVWQADRRRRVNALLAAEHEKARLARLHAMLSEGNRLIVRVPGERELFEVVCRIAVSHGGLRFAWVGLLQPDGSVRVAARAGEDHGYIDQVRARIEGGDARGVGPTGRAIREGAPAICNHFLEDPATAPWHAAAAAAGVGASGAFPILRQGAAVGAINFHAADPDFFGDPEVRTLMELADDIGFALDNAAREIERRRLEQALRDGEARFRALFDHSPVSTMIHDPATGQLVQANRAAWESYGLSSEAELKAYDMWCDPPHSFAEAKAWMARAVREGAQRFEWRSRRADGVEFWESVQISPIDIGAETRVVSISVDITDQKRAEEALRLRSASLEAAANAVVITDPGGRIEWANPAFTRVTGYTLEECLGKNPSELVRSGEQDEAFYQEMWRRILAGETWSGELVNRRKDGTLYAEEMTITPVRDEGGAITHFIAIKQDISARKALEEEFRQAQKMESIGRLAGGVAHDFNNLLSVISGYTEIALGMVADDDPIHRDLAQVKRAADRAANLTRQLLAFSRRQVLRPKVVDLNHIVADAEKMFRRLIGEDVELVVDLDPGLGRVVADPGQIEQVLMNLVVNARDAMPTGGRLTIETRDEFVQVERNGNHDALPGGRCARVSVRDTGVGMDEALLARIFDPFFTTKEQGKGTGLGLAMVYGVMKQSGGGVRVESRPGQGTVFHLYLPCAAEHEAGEAAPEAPAQVPRGTETVLLVEDEPNLRILGERVLAAAGYTVLPAANGGEALAIAESRPDPVHLLLTDVVMPGMSGKDVADALRARHPALKVVYMSGYTDDILTNHGALDPGIVLLAKPFSTADLARTVRAALDAPAA